MEIFFRNRSNAAWPRNGNRSAGRAPHHRGGRASRYVRLQAVFAAVGREDRKEPAGEVAQLHVADAGNLPHPLRRGRPHPRQLPQHGIPEDHIRLLLPFLRDLPPQLAQRLEQRLIDALPRHLRGRRLLRLLALLAAHQPHQPHRPLAAHHLPRRLIQIQQRIFVAHLHQHFLAEQLVQPVAHVGLALALEQAERRQLVVPAAADVVALLAAQHGNDVVDPETLFHTGHARQDLLRHHRRPGHLLGVAQAQIAGAARLGRVLLAEMLHQRPMAADSPAGVAVHLFEVAEGVRVETTGRPPRRPPTSPGST